MPQNKSRQARKGVYDTHGKYTVAFPFRTIHLDIVVTPVFDLPYGEWRLHEPRQ